MTNAYTNVTSQIEGIISEIVAEAKTSPWAANPALISGFDHCATGQIMSLATDGLANMDGSRYPVRGIKTSTQDVTLAYDRGALMDVGTVDFKKSGGIATAGAVVGEITRSSIIPELDAARVARVASSMASVSGHYTSGYTAAKATILGKIEEGIQAIQDDTGIDQGMNIFVSGKCASMLKQSTEVTQSRSIDAVNSAAGIDSNVYSIDGNRVHFVPSNRMYTAITVDTGSDSSGASTSTGNTAGYAKATGAKDVIAVITAPDTAQAITVINNSKIIAAEDNQSGDGTLIGLHVYHDLVIPNNRKKGVYVLTS